MKNLKEFVVVDDGTLAIVLFREDVESSDFDEVLDSFDTEDEAFDFAGLENSRR